MTRIARAAAAMLAAWDGTLSKDSAAAALYETWLPRLKTALAAAVAPGRTGQARRAVDPRRPGAC